MSQLYIEDIELGDEIGPIMRTPTREQLDAFTNVWGIGIGRFTDDTVAQSEGFTGVILPGSMSMAFLAQILTEWAGQHRNLKRLECNFRRSIQPDDVLKCLGIITDIRSTAENNEVILDVHIENQKGERPVQGTALVVLPNSGK